jgi:ABC-type multidrug transport system fused ATPase/permease subunit
MTAEQVEFVRAAPAPIGRIGPASALRLSSLAGTLYRMTGRAIAAAFLATIPAGLLLGGVEVVTAYVLYLVLVKFNVLSAAGQPQWLPAVADPLAMLAMSVVLTAVLRYIVQVLPGMANSAFECRIRKAAALAVLDGSGEGGTLSVAETSHLYNTVSPKSGVFLQAVMTSLGLGSVLVLILMQLAYLSWRLTLLAIVVAVISGAPLLWLKRIYGRFSDRTYELHREFGHRFLKDARNALFLKLCGLSRYEADRLGHIARLVRANGHRYALLFAIGSNVPFVAGAAMIAGLLWLNERYQLMAMADLVPFVYLLNRVAGNFVALSTTTGQIRELIPYVTELLGYESILFPEVASVAPTGIGVTPAAAALEVKNLGYGRREPLTPPLSFAVRSGEMLLISGPSGRGKTTLLMSLLGLIPPLSGQIEWDGVALDRLDAVELRHRVGFAGSEPFLIDADIRTNLMFGLESADRTGSEIDHALVVACAEFVHDLDGGLAFKLRENGDGISAGQKQRLALARCILRRPDVLILDEATANLDEATERLFFSRLLEAYPAMMVIAVSHRSSLRAYATRFLEI